MMQYELTCHETPSERFVGRFGVPRWLFILIAIVFGAGPALLALLAVAPVAAGVLILIGAVALLRFIGNWILGPFASVTPTNTGPAQFTLADFFSLVFVVQLSLGMIHALCTMRSREMPGAVIVLACLLCSLVWYINVRRLSHSGIARPLHRLAFLAGVLPLVYLGLPFMVAGPASFIMRPSYIASPGTAATLLVLFVTVLLPIGFCWAAFFVRRMLAESLASRDASE